VVALAGNILVNIESDKDYSEAQAMFICKAAEALRPGGHVYLDFDLHINLSSSLDDSCYFHGTDDFGTSGKFSDEPIDEPLQSQCRATIWARKEG
jgi:hypothetical protein